MDQSEEKSIEQLKEKYDSLPTLVGVNGNAFAIMGHFQKYARRAEWDQEDIDFVLEQAQSGDYNNLLNTIQQFTD